MTTLTIGRFSMSDGPSAIRHDGDNLDLDFQIDAATTSSVTVAKVLRQQLLGLANNADEPVVPLTFDDDTDLNGFYVVEGVSCEPLEMYLNNGSMLGSVSLRRVGGYSFPQQELITGAFTRTNNHALVGEAIAATYPAFTAAIADSTSWATATFTRTTADSATPLQIATETPTVAPFAFSAWMPADRYYIGACRVEVNIGRTGGTDGPWYTVTGRQPGPYDYWRIDNGIIRLTSAVDRATGTFEEGEIAVWTGSAWESRYIRHFTSAGAADVIGLSYDTNRGSPIAILRNSPECVVIRCAGQGGQVVDYSIKRGAMHVEMSSSIKSGIGFATASACTAITGGIRSTANDANGNQVVFGIAETLVSDTVNGYIYQNLAGVNRTNMMVGVSLNGSTAAANNVPAELIKQFIGVAPIRQRVVTR